MPRSKDDEVEFDRERECVGDGRRKSLFLIDKTESLGRAPVVPSNSLHPVYLIGSIFSHSIHDHVKNAPLEISSTLSSLILPLAPLPRSKSDSSPHSPLSLLPESLLTASHA